MHHHKMTVLCYNDKQSVTVNTDKYNYLRSLFNIYGLKRAGLVIILTVLKECLSLLG